ncbi:nucleolar protein NOP52 variant [Moelleriella libera RCEF 2490]|uniref:Nucleolar protein NOP52 variant n=1 Tax=Moelleriella libera RCEF 2490 TaxID=1081109 RepID=A0A168EJQ1_9HYPO|nr:nucleolar protein NOP52 variant [Moelleriella libera RCEF 2490]
MDARAASMPFIRNLASSGTYHPAPAFRHAMCSAVLCRAERETLPPLPDRKLRTQSLASLQSYLATTTTRTLSGLEAQKLWTGLYYALWMTAGPRAQNALATDLAALLVTAPAGSAPAFLRAFWSVLSSQWAAIDSHRMDKFLLLARRGFAAHLRRAMASNHHDDDNNDNNNSKMSKKRKTTAAAQSNRGEERVAEEENSQERDLVVEVLREGCFGDNVALGLRLHVLDIWVDELQREGALEQEQEREQEGGLVRRIGDVVDALRSCPVKSVRARAQESYADERLPWAPKNAGQQQEEDDEEDDEQDGDGEPADDEWGGISE